MRAYLKVLTPLVLTGMALAQGPVTDKVKVTFPNPVVVAGTTLPAGEYMIRQLPSANNPRVLEFSSDDGMKVEVTTTAFPILDNMNRKPTSVILEQRGNAYHVSKIWLAGKNYGYGLPTSGDSTAIASNDNNGLKLTASYAPARQETVQTETRREETTVAQATPPQQPEPAPAPTPAQTQQQTQDQAQATPPEQPAPTPTPAQTEPAPAAQEPVQVAQNNTPAPATPAMPETAAHWPLLMLAGGALSVAGLRLRK